VSRSSSPPSAVCFSSSGLAMAMSRPWVMGRDQDGDAVGGERVDQVPESPARGRLDPRGRFIEKQDRWPMQHRAAEREALLPTAGERRHQRVLAARKPGHVDGEAHALA
jgi:hypothetical protein